MPVEACYGCGWRVEGGYAGCKSRFDEFLARDFNDALYFRTHRLLVDTYCLQHPDDYCASAKSLAAHLVGLCWILEEGASPAVGPAELHRWLNGAVGIEMPIVPAHRGAMTIGDLKLSAGAAEWDCIVHEWASRTWDAYSSLHATARGWLAAARTS